MQMSCCGSILTRLLFSDYIYMKLESTQRLHTFASRLLGGVYKEASHPTHQATSQDLHIYMNKNA